MEQQPAKIHVREAELRDAGALDRLIIYLDGFHAQARPDLFREPSETPRGADFLQKTLEDPLQQILVSGDDGELAGYVHVIVKETAASPYKLERRYAEIDAIAVHPARQRLGIGRILLEAAISWSADQNVSDLQIGVHEFNASARALYERLGFVPSVTMLRRTG